MAGSTSANSCSSTNENSGNHGNDDEMSQSPATGKRDEASQDFSQRAAKKRLRSPSSPNRGEETSHKTSRQLNSYAEQTESNEPIPHEQIQEILSKFDEFDDTGDACNKNLPAEQLFYKICRHKKFLQLFPNKVSPVPAAAADDVDNNVTMEDSTENIKELSKPAQTDAVNDKVQKDRLSSDDQALQVAVLDLLIALDNNNADVNQKSCLLQEGDDEKVILHCLNSNYTGSMSPCDVRLLSLLTNYYASNYKSVERNIPILPSKLYAERQVWGREFTEADKQINLEDFLRCFKPDLILATARHFPLRMHLDMRQIPQITSADSSVSDTETSAELKTLYDVRYLLLCYAALLTPPIRQKRERFTAEQQEPKVSDKNATAAFSISKFVTSHSLQLIFASLASIDPGTRSLGYYCIQRFHTLCKTRRTEFAGKAHLLTILSSLERSLWTPRVRLSSMWTLFLGRACELVFLPQERIFRTVADELFQHDTFELRSVPAFTRFILSTSTSITTGAPATHHRRELSFLLSNILVPGVRTPLDVQLLNRYGSWHILQALALAAPVLVGGNYQAGSRLHANVRQIMVSAVQVLLKQPLSSSLSENRSINWLNPSVLVVENDNFVIKAHPTYAQQLRTLSMLWKEYGFLQFIITSATANDSSMPVYAAESEKNVPNRCSREQMLTIQQQQALDCATLVHAMFTAARARILPALPSPNNNKTDAESAAAQPLSLVRIVWKLRPAVFASAALASALDATLKLWYRLIMPSDSLLVSGSSIREKVDDDGNNDDSVKKTEIAKTRRLDTIAANVILRLIIDLGMCYQQLALPFEWSLWDCCFRLLKRILSSDWLWTTNERISDSEDNLLINLLLNIKENSIISEQRLQ